MILLTGVTGFLGKRVAKQLQESNTQFVGTSLSMGVDFRDREQVFNLFDKVKPTYVLHCASYVGGIQFGLKHTGEMFYNNSLIFVNLLEACRSFNVQRLVNPISNCAYPGTASLFKEEEFWNGSLHDSVLFYGMVRKMSYVGALAYQRQYGLDTVNIILSNMYGPEDHFEQERSHALGAMIMKFVHARNNDLPSVTVWGTGNPVREWLYIDDGAEAMVRSMSIQPFDGIINIGTAQGISIRETAMLIKRLVHYNGEIIFDHTKIDGAPYKTVDGSLGKKLMNWSPQKDFNSGVKETIDWYEKNIAEVTNNA